MSEIPEILSRYSNMQDDPIRWIYRPDAFSK